MSCRILSGRIICEHTVCAQIIHAEIVCALDSFVSVTPIQMWGKQ